MRKQVKLCLVIVSLLLTGKVFAQDCPLCMTFQSVSVSQPTGTNTALIKWTIAVSEYNLQYYEIEASRNSCFAPIGRVVPAVPNNGPISKNYSFTHTKPFKGLTYYRIKAVNLDDQASYSNIVVLNCTTCPPLSVPDCNTTMSITGPSAVCDAPAQFGLINRPSYPATITWSVTPGGIAGFSWIDACDAKLTKVTNGVVTLKAQITGCPGTINKTILVGTPPLTLDKNTVFYYPTYTRYHVDVTLLPGTTAAEYRWYKNGVYLGTGATRTILVYNTDGCEDLQVKVTTPCGESIGSTSLCFQAPPSCEGFTKFSVSPVPARGGMLTIRQAALPPPCESQARLNTSTDLYTIKILDMNGGLKKQVNNVSLKNNYQLEVNNLPDGNYILRITAPDQKEETKQIRIEK